MLHIPGLTLSYLSGFNFLYVPGFTLPHLPGFVMLYISGFNMLHLPGSTISHLPGFTMAHLAGLFTMLQRGRALDQQVDQDGVLRPKAMPQAVF